MGPEGWTPPPAPLAVVPPPSTSPSPKPERDWWRRLSLEGGRALCSAAQAAAAAAAAFPLAVRASGTAEAAGGWRWEAARPRTQAVAKFPRRASWGSQLLATRDRSEKGSEIFNLEEKSTSFPLSGSLSLGSQRRERQTWAPRLHSQQTELWRISGLGCSGAALPGAGQGV